MLSPKDSQHGRPAWMVERLYAFLILLAMGAILTSEAWSEILVRSIQDPGATYIFMVPGVVAWLVYVRRFRLRHCRPRNLYVGYILLILGALAYLSGARHGLEYIWQVGALIGLVGCFVTFYGTDFLAKFAPAFALLFLVIPLPGPVEESITSLMERLTVAGLYTIGDLAGVGVNEWGRFLAADGSRLVGGARLDLYCMTFATLLMAVAFAFGNPYLGYVRLSVIAAVPMLCLVCNALRMVFFSWGAAAFGWAAHGYFFHLSVWGMLLLESTLLAAAIRFARWTLVPLTPYHLVYNR